MSKILIANDFSVSGLALLKSIFPDQVETLTTKVPTRDDLKDTQALLVRSGTKVTKDFLEKAPNLRVVVTSTAGFDHLDLKELQTRNIAAMHCPEAHTESTAQLAIAHMLNLTRSLHPAEKAVRTTNWRSDLHRKDSLDEMQLGIIGFGRIGRRVAELAQAFKMEVSAYDPYVETNQMEGRGVTPKSLMEIFKESDIISFHVPLTKETKHMVNEKTLEHMNPNAYIVNVSRGGVINEMELAVYMRKGHLLGAALDVFEKEPLKKDSPLQDLSNVIFSAHIGAYTMNAFEKGSMEAARKTIGFLQTGVISNSLPPKEEWSKHLFDFRA